ncbi:hypothetical protein ACQUY5_16660 [Bacillus cereus]|uniref:hypothetical protein n=1 Tax=Bacillus cereus TaxID=1396 RepID=UPI003D1871EA
MLKVKMIQVANSDEIHIYVHDQHNTLYVDAGNEDFFQEWCKIVGVELPQNSMEYIFETVKITNYEIDRDIEVQEFSYINEIPIHARQFECIVESENYRHVVGYALVESHKTTLYKPKRGTPSWLDYDDVREDVKEMIPFAWITI